MFLMTKLLTQLILPPGGLILMAAAGLIFCKRWWGRGLIFLSIAFFWLLSTEPVRDMLLNPLEQAYAPLQIDQLPDREKLAIVLLGGGVYEKAPEFSGIDSLSGYGLMRTLYAAEIANRTGLDVYTSGGAVLSQNNEPSGVVMQQWLKRFGVAESAIHVEADAATTWENAANIKALLAEKDIATVLLVTTAWHMPRSVWSFQQQGLKVIAAPCDYQVKRSPYDLRSYLPHWSVFSGSCDALHEYLGSFWYRIKQLI